ncbi:MAG: repeat protein, partial [Chitinophagaceae bacterium]|nr:repeat protein [Chitinophagaceae bacterium]
TDITMQLGNNFKHTEDNYFDFNDQWFIPHELSTQGPKVAVGDVNKDGLEDFFVCGAKNQAGAIFLQQKNGSFKPSEDTTAFVKDKACEEVNAVFFDADNDGDLDLYVVSGGNIYTGITSLLNDKLYMNDGKGHFTFSDNLPAMYENKSVACVADVDHDGDLDIFVGGRSISRNYGKVPPSYLLINDGKGKFSFAETDMAKSLEHLGMVTDAGWTDIDKDGWPDLLVVGEWMQPVLFKNDHGVLKKTALTGDDQDLKGWWCCAKMADLNGDGFDDILLGNYGLNSKLTASAEYPLKMFSTDISGTGRDVQILAVAKEKKYYPFLNKEDLEKQLPYLKKEFLRYGEMAGLTVERIFDKKLDHATVFTASTFASVVLMNDGKGHYTATQLPASFQYAPIFSFNVNDYNGDGKKDIMAGGNFFGTTPYEGRYDAMALAVALADAQGSFKPIMPLPLSFEPVSGEVRSIQPVKLANHKKGLLVGMNNDRLRLFEYR